MNHWTKLRNLKEIKNHDLKSWEFRTEMVKAGCSDSVFFIVTGWHELSRSQIQNLSSTVLVNP